MTHLKCQEYQYFTDEMMLTELQMNNALLECIYRKHKDYCCNFMRSKLIKHDENIITDIYHEAMIVLYEKVMTGNFKLTSSIQTYLNSICYYQLLNYIKKEKLTISKNELLKNAEDDILEVSDDLQSWLLPNEKAINEYRIDAIAEALKTMETKNGNCYELLYMIYFRSKTMQFVANFFGYANEQIARNKAYRCRERLRDLTFIILNKTKMQHEG